MKKPREFVESNRTGANNPETTMGHWVGMATHDVGTHTGPLKAGMEKLMAERGILETHAPAQFSAK